MIKINLLGDTTGHDDTAVLWIGGFVLSLIVFVGAAFLLHQDVSTSLASAQIEKEGLENELTQIKKVTKEVRELEKKQKELEEKLTIIATLKKNKLGPVRVMDDLNLAVPERAWLTGLKENRQLMRIDGFALDNQTVANFMKDLEKSDYFQTVNLQQSKTAVREGVNIKSFALQATISYSGAAKPAEGEEEEGKEKKKRTG